MSVRGSAFYGYKDIRDNVHNIKNNLAEMFAESRPIPKPVDNGGGIIIGRPVNNATVNTSGVNIMAGSNPAFPVYFNNQRVPRTKSGFFSVYAPLAAGRNNLVFTQNNSDVTHVVTRGDANVSPSQPVFQQMDSYKIELLSPGAQVVATPGDRVQVRVRAPSGSRVTASLSGASVTLEPETDTTDMPDEGGFMAVVYSGIITLPATQPDGSLFDLGTITFAATRGSETADLTGHNVKLVNNTVFGLACEVIRDFASLKVATASSWVNDYLPAAIGMRDRITGFENGHFRLSFGGYISANDVVLTPERQLLTNRIMSAVMEDTGDVTEIRFGVSENVPVNAVCRNGVFTITLFNTPHGGRRLDLADNPIFSGTSVANNRAEQSVTYTLNLIHPDNFYGFEVVYENSFIIIRVRNPMRRIEGEQPLRGLTIAVDAGHGGRDPGAMGFLGVHGKNEADLNLDVSLALRDILTDMGADVVMTRETDITFELADRAFFINDANPDLLISIHYNSMGDAQDNTRINGVLQLYSNESGRLFATSVGRGLAAELNRFLRDTRFMDLGIARNHKFPAALIEIAFITNPDEYEFALSAEGIQRSAQGIANGVTAWIDAQARFVR
jgi:N-acetylmuramoyl-L-alanine amidase